MEPIDLTTFDTERSLDNLKGNGAMTYTVCTLAPESRQVTVYQDDSDTAVTLYRWHGREFSINIDADNTNYPPHPGDLREFLTSDEGQAMLDAIIDGYEREWDGSNYKGRLTEAGEDALRQIERAIADLRRDEREWWTCEEWFHGEESSFVNANSTEEEIALAAAAAKRDAELQGQALADDPERHLAGWVERQIEDAWRDLWYASDCDESLDDYKTRHNNDLAAARKAEAEIEADNAAHNAAQG